MFINFIPTTLVPSPGLITVAVVSTAVSHMCDNCTVSVKLAKVLGNSHATHGSGLALTNCIVADHSQLCYTICTMKAPPQALEGPGEEPLWHLS